MNTKRFLIDNEKLRVYDVPASFVAGIAGETEMAIYVYGHVVVDGRICARCGHELTDENSKTVGLCKECLDFWYPDWHVGINLKEKVERIPVDHWIPKSTIILKEESDEVIELPSDHEMARKSRIASLECGEIVVRFPYNANDVKVVKKISGRRYNAIEKNWVCPLSVKTVKILSKAGFEISEELKKVGGKK